MPFTREFIRKAAKESGVEIPKELEDALVQEHLDARNAYAEAQVTAYKGEHPEQQAQNVEDTQEYKDLKKSFDDYKTEIAAKETRAAKLNAGRAILKDAGVPENRIDTLMRAYDVDGIELDEHGAATDIEARVAKAKTDFASFIPTTTETGVKTATPPSTSQGAKDPGQMTMAEYIKYRKGE